MPLIIRRAIPKDVEIIVEYNCRLALESEGKTLDPSILTVGVQAVLENDQRGQYHLAELDGRVIGQLMITTEWSDWRNGWFWWIQSVYVHADARRQGVFKALYQHILEQARSAKDVIGIRLYVEHENRTAQQTYERLGMVQAGYEVLERCPL